MSESEKLLSKKGTKRNQSSSKKQPSKLFANQDDYGTLTKQYIVEDEYPRLLINFCSKLELFL